MIILIIDYVLIGLIFTFFEVKDDFLTREQIPILEIGNYVLTIFLWPIVLVAIIMDIINER